jgi:hypothetical protein
MAMASRAFVLIRTREHRETVPRIVGSRQSREKRSLDAPRLMGHDAGSPVLAHAHLGTTHLTKYQAGEEQARIESIRGF